MRHFTSIIPLVALALLGTGCPNRPNPPLAAPPPAVVTAFVASPQVVQAGGTIKLEWGTSNATDVTIEQVGKGPLDLGGQKTAGTLSIRLDADAVFLITAQGAGGSDVRATSVALERKALSILFSAIPTTVEAGQPVTLVWNAPGARAVKLEELGGAALPVGAQLESGTLQTTPTKTTSYRLTADDQTATVEVKVAPTITRLEAAGGLVPGPGDQVVIQWQTVAASTVSLRRVGLAQPFTLPTGMVATGSYTDTVPTILPPDAVLQYVLEASDGTTMVSRQIEVPVGGGVRINAFTVPAYSLLGTTYTVSWSTAGADSAELIVDGQRAYLAQSRAEVASGQYTLPTPTQNSHLELVVRNDRGATARESRTIQGVGSLAYNFFRADKPAIAAAGEPVTLEWSVANARSVRITSDANTGFFREFTGNVDTGTVQVLPNLPLRYLDGGVAPASGTVTYELEASNGTPGSTVRRTVQISVGARATFTFSRTLPIGSNTTASGVSISGATSALGFKSVEKNPSDEAFVDIRSTGTPVNFSGASSAANFVLPAAFEGTLFGSRYRATRLNVSQLGWFVLTTSSATLVGRPDNDPAFGTTLEPLTIAPYWRNLISANGQVHWKLDTTPTARRLIVQWTGVRPAASPLDARLTFQAQLYSNGKVVFAYKDFFKIQGAGTSGVVNASENDEVRPAMPVAAGEVYRFFGGQAFPAPAKVQRAPHAAGAIVNGLPMELEGDATIAPGLFRISEVSYRPPMALTDAQWLEVTSNSDAGIDLSGWDVSYGGLVKYTIPQGTTLQPFSRLLLGQATDLSDPDGPDAGGFPLEDGGFAPRVPADLIYPSTLVPPTSDAFARLSLDGIEYDRFPGIAAGLPQTIATGRSYQLEDYRPAGAIYESATTRFLCPALRASYGTNGQWGSPGAPNPPCFPYERPEPITQPFASIADGGTALTLSSLDDGQATFTLAQPIRVFGVSVTSLTIGANGGIPFGATSLSLSNKDTPSSGSPTFVIAPFWDDLHGGRNAGSRLFGYQAPNGDVTISWENWSFFSANTTTNPANLNFQVNLRASGEIEFVYGTMTGGGTVATRAQGDSATTWIDIGPAAMPININTAAIQSNTAFRYRPAAGL